MDLAIAFLAGAMLGWTLARLRRGDQERGGQRTFRPNKRQRKILATLPPDPVRPSLEELIAEEAAELGVDSIPGADAVHLGIRLKVWRRDQPFVGPCPPEHLVFVLSPNVSPAAAGETDLRLECRQDDEAGTALEDGSRGER